MDDVIERNQRQSHQEKEAEEEAAKEGGYAAAKPAKAVKKEESSDEEEEKPVGNTQKPIKDSEINFNDLSRKQREQIQADAAKKKYEELHKQGKTDEAKADLGRLEEVKKRRAEAAAKKAEEAAKAAEMVAPQKGGAMSAEVREALGGDQAKMRGARSAANKTKKGDGEKFTKVKGPDLFTYVKAEDIKEAPKEVDVDKKDGTINSCRAAEEDFM